MFFDFDVKSVNNGGDELKAIVTFRTSVGQVTPIRVRVILDKKSSNETTNRIYETRAEKIQGLREGPIDEFVSGFLDKNWTNDDIEKFIENNKNIIKSEDNELEKDEIVKILENRKEQKNISG